MKPRLCLHWTPDLNYDSYKNITLKPPVFRPLDSQRGATYAVSKLPAAEIATLLT